jgi:hypothetical protein
MRYEENIIFFDVGVECHEDQNSLKKGELSLSVKIVT